MGWANASYLEAVAQELPEGVLTGRDALRRLRKAVDLDGAATAALRRYSRSEFPRQEDGKVLNAALLTGDPVHDQWAEDMDGAFAWRFDRDVLLWRGYANPPEEQSAIPCFTSASLVERQARKIRSQGGTWVAAIVLPAGFPVAVPAAVWSEGDDERTLGVVRREVEVILPRGSMLFRTATVDGLAVKGRGSGPMVPIYRAQPPALDLAYGFRG